MRKGTAHAFHQLRSSPGLVTLRSKTIRDTSDRYVARASNETTSMIGYGQLGHRSLSPRFTTAQLKYFKPVPSTALTLKFCWEKANQTAIKVDQLSFV